ncbi:uroporphyrinogen decarboxylase [bacterium]|nr:uroporphyrinogen decarboxylase [bacterium]
MAEPTTLTPTRTYMQNVRGETTETLPVWLMRQAGRYLPEYLEVRGKYSFLDVCHTPELACEVTLQPIRRYGFDASILFSDILVPLAPMGAKIDFNPGPEIANPLRTYDDLKQVKTFEAREKLPEVLEAVSLIRRELPEETSFIGFAGAPFTLASYWIEGGKPEPFATIKTMMYTEPKLFHEFLDQLAQMVAEYLVAQAEAGANAVQVFDTWAGVLTLKDFREHLLPSLHKIFTRLREAGIPSTYYAKGAAHLLPALGDLGASVISLDWRIDIEEARRTLGETTVFQGNLDPTVLLGDEATIRRETRHIIDVVGDRPHVFNLGHGILRMTPIDNVHIMLDEIRNGGRA